MPNHTHGIIEISTPGADSISAHPYPPKMIWGRNGFCPYTSPIPEIMQSFKRHTTVEHITRVKRHIVPPFLTPRIISSVDFPEYL